MYDLRKINVLVGIMEISITFAVSELVLYKLLLYHNHTSLWLEPIMALTWSPDSLTIPHPVHSDSAPQSWTRAARQYIYQLSSGLPIRSEEGDLAS